MAAKVVSDFLASDAIVVFSKSYCPFCNRTKALLDGIPAKYTAIELDQRPDGDAIQNHLLELTGGRSVPRVFIAKEFIGGNDDTHALHAAGGLVPKIVEAGAKL